MTTTYIEEVASCFGHAQYRYDRASHLQREIGERLTSLLQPHCGTIDHALELGCGTGAYLVELRHHLNPRQLTGCDIAEPLLRQLARRDPAVPGVRANFQQLPFASESFDLVTANMSLQWSPDLNVALAEARRVLKPGGTLAFSMPIDPSFAAARQILERAEVPRLLNRFETAENVKHALQGFSLSSWCIERYDQRFAGIVELLHSFREFGGQARTGDDRRPITAPEFRRLLRMAQPAPVCLDWVIAFVVATRESD